MNIRRSSTTVSSKDQKIDRNFCFNQNLDPHLRGDDDFLEKISTKFLKKICYNTNLDPHLRGDDDFLQKIPAKSFKKICFNQTTTKTWIPTRRNPCGCAWG